MWDTSCPDWENRILAGASLIPELPLYTDRAEKARRIFLRLKVPDIKLPGIEGTPTMAQACGEWFLPIVEAVFGGFEPNGTTRALQEFFLMVPKGNSKTSYSAALLLVALIMNDIRGAEFVLVAPSKDIANYSLKQAKGTIEEDPELVKLFHIVEHQRKIRHLRTNAELVIKAADTDAITGGKQLGTLIDETHVFASHGRAANVFQELRGALGKNDAAFLIQTTTQSKEAPAGVFASELRNARDVRDGKLRLKLLPVLYELPTLKQKNGGWEDKKLWPRVNPNMGRSVRMSFLEQEYSRAKNEGESALALFAATHLNVEIGIGLSVGQWEGAEHWSKIADPTLTLEELIRRSEVAVVGIDGGGLDDLLGFCVIGREKVTKKWLIWTHAWCFAEVLKKRKEISPKLLDYQKDGDLTICDEVGQDVADVADYIEWLDAEGLLPEKGAIGVDPVGIADIITELERRKFDVTPESARVVGITQGWQMSNTIKTTARHVAAGTVAHSGSRMMDWVIGNAKQEPRGNAVAITKQVAGKAKIDPLMAFFDAAALMLRNPQARASVYGERGLLVI